MLSQRIKRKHGLQRPFNNYQIASWVILFYEFASAYLIFLPILQGLEKVTLTFKKFIEKTIFVGIISSTIVLLVFNGYLATATDPTDPTVAEENAAREKGHVCSLCNSHVKPRTKHCGQCDRCVDVFDHHCQWFNNCIGGKNYRNFAVSIIVLFLQASIKIIFGAVCINRFGQSQDGYIEDIANFYGLEIKTPFVVLGLTILSLALNIIIWLLTLQLLILHSWLKSHKMTTYEYIVMKRQRMQDAASGKPREYKSKVIKRVDEQNPTNQSLHSFQAEEQTNIKLLSKSWVTPNNDVTIHDANHTKRLDKSEIRAPAKENTTPFFKDSGEANLPVIKDHNTSMVMDTEGEECKNGQEEHFSAHQSHNSRPITFDDEPDPEPEPIEVQLTPKLAVSMPGSEHKLYPIKTTDREREDADCNLEKSELESSKIMRFVEAVKDKVVFKNPLNKLLFLGLDIDGADDNLSLVSHPSLAEKGEVSMPMSARNSQDLGKSTNDEEAHPKSHRGFGETKGFTYSKILSSFKAHNMAKLEQVLGGEPDIMSARSSGTVSEKKSARIVSARDYEDLSMEDGNFKVASYGNSTMNQGFKFKNTFSGNDFP